MRSHFLALGLVIVCVSTAAAQQRTFVSVSGVDNVSCSRTSPCRSFGAAVTAAAPGGEVIAIDSGGYGPFSINKAISVIAPPGVYAGVTVSSGAGVTVNAPGANVTLRGLIITGIGGTTGIQVDAAAEIRVDSVLAGGLVGDGLLINAAQSMIVRDCVFRSNNYGINIPNLAGTLYGIVERTRFDGNTASGATIRDFAQVEFIDSTFFNNTDGLVVIPASALASAPVDGCVFVQGSRGIVLTPVSVTSNAVTYVGRSTFFRVNDPIHRDTGTGSLGAFTFVNNQFGVYSYSPVFDTTLALK